jgi:hypothetical protein
METTTKAKHTPGPWKLSHGGLPGDSGFSIVSNNAEAENVKVTAECWPCTIVSEEHRQELFANARLIASAPELLEALTSLLAMVEFAIDKNDGDIYGQVYSEVDHQAVIANARAAIAKATAE